MFITASYVLQFGRRNTVLGLALSDYSVLQRVGTLIPDHPVSSPVSRLVVPKFLTPLCSSTCLVFQGDTFDTFFSSVIGRATKEVLLSLTDQLKRNLRNSHSLYLIKFSVGEKKARTKHSRKVTSACVSQG